MGPDPIPFVRPELPELDRVMRRLEPSWSRGILTNGPLVAELEARMADQIARRDASQPTKDRSAGSTFRNPAGFSSTGRADDSQELKAWTVIDAAGMRGARRGGAQMSEKHSNFMINAGGATAADLEELGEEVRKRVFDQTGLTLEWEIMRVGEPAAQNQE